MPRNKNIFTRSRSLRAITNNRAQATRTMSRDASSPMYDAERYTRATVGESPSLLANNLTAGPSTLAYVHDTQAVMVPTERLLAGARTEKLPMLTKSGNRTATQVKSVTLGASSFFVLCTIEGVHFFDEHGYERVHYHGFAENQHAGLERDGSVVVDGGGVARMCGRGVCSSCSRDGRAQVLVGTSTGDVMVFEFDGESFRKTEHDVSIEPGRRVPVADVATEVDSRRGTFPPDCALRVEEQCAAVSANDSGVIVAWDVFTSDRLERSFAIQRPGPIVSLAIRNGVAAAAESGGAVCFVSLQTKRVFCELQAHARFLSAMAMHPARDVVATVAEDGTIAVWGLPTELSGDGLDHDAAAIVRRNPTPRFAARWPDGALTGVAFCGDGDDALAVCAYDETDVVAWQ